MLGEIIDVKSNEIIVRLSNGIITNIELYNSDKNLKIGDKIPINTFQYNINNKIYNNFF
ncbi:hypothetical protein [Clostridium niameyense]|uniref:hypothetical protein n=1 Tax=Clostridium niameyense TaxID=1622073 RepID=UPI000A642D16|nr:hypothetical protein [Clostridium niameyense]